MEAASNFFIAFILSFIGSIPPGSLNISILQLGLEQRIHAAWRFAFAAAIIEYIYTWLAIKFDDIILKSIDTIQHLNLIAALILIALGTANLLSVRKNQEAKSKGYQRSGFRHGFFLAIVNPMALPFWVAVTAYLKTQHWIFLSDSIEVQTYLIGVALGGFTFLIVVAYLSVKFTSQLQKNTLAKKIPGMVLITLGLYAIARFFIN